MALRRIAGWTALALALVALLAAWSYRQALTRPYAGWQGESVDVVFEAGLGAGAMLERLADRGVVRHPAAVELWLRLHDRSRALHAGEYRFDRPASALEVLRRLESGDVLLYALTIPEGLNLAEVSERVAASGLGDREAVRRAFADPAPIADLDGRAEDLEGYLFPDTYHFPRDVRPGEIAAAMVARFRSVANARFLALAETSGLTLREAVTLASMIEKETSVHAERSRISRVFHNRLARKMRMQCDPTVRYALEREGRVVGKLTYRDLAFDSPWNTYVARGLPPGPIANPGAASLMAAVDPAEGDELYFVAAPGGGHSFSDDLQTHQRAVAVWRKHSRSTTP